MKEILIFRTDRVGDLLFSLILIKIIKKNYPNCRITLIVSPIETKSDGFFTRPWERSDTCSSKVKDLYVKKIPQSTHA